MKVGIITMHRVPNCGSALQAYGLQRTIEQLGFDAELIDYDYPNDYHTSIRPIPKAPFIIRLADDIYGKLNAMWIKSLFAPFYKRFYKLSAKRYRSCEDIRNNPPEYDCYVSGSDQVWNPRYIGEDTNFMLDFIDNPNKVAYAGSLANKDIDIHLEMLYSDALHKYKAVSVREEGSCKYASILAGKKAEFVLDPSMLLTPKEWQPVLDIADINVPDKYMLVYVLGYSFDVYEYAAKVINYIHETTGMEVLVFVFSRKKRSLLVNHQTISKVSPENFLCLISHASLVVTDSFHASAFSINFSVPLYPLVSNKKSKDNRVTSLLTSLGAEDWLIEKETSLSELPTVNKEYHSVQDKLEKYRSASIIYLQENIS